MSINPTEIEGNWDKGYVLDKHSISSVPKGENVYGRIEYETTRTELGELIFQLKYRSRYENINKIVDLVAPFLDSFKELKEVDIALPVPASKDRDFQPVDELTKAIAEYLHISFSNEVLEKTTSSQSKNMDRTNKNLKGTIKANLRATRSHSILLIDDLYSTGETMSACVSVLREDPLLKKIFVLAMTRTK